MSLMISTNKNLSLNQKMVLKKMFKNIINNSLKKKGIWPKKD